MISRSRFTFHARWLRKNIVEDDRLLMKYHGSMDILKIERDKIHSILDLFSNFSLGDGGRYMIGKQELKLVMVEEAIEKIKAYVSTIDKHLTILITQALLLAQDFDDEIFMKTGYKVVAGEPDIDKVRL